MFNLAAMALCIGAANITGYNSMPLIAMPIQNVNVTNHSLTYDTDTTSQWRYFWAADIYAFDSNYDSVITIGRLTIDHVLTLHDYDIFNEKTINSIVLQPQFNLTYTNGSLLVGYYFTFVFNYDYNDLNADVSTYFMGSYTFDTFAGPSWDSVSSQSYQNIIIYTGDYKTGYDSGYEIGEDVGYDTGYDLGKDAGYDIGYATAEGRYGTSYVDWLVNAVGGFLDFRLFDNFTLGGLLGTVIAASIMIWLLKVFAGG